MLLFVLINMSFCSSCNCFKFRNIDCQCFVIIFIKCTWCSNRNIALKMYLSLNLDMQNTVKYLYAHFDVTYIYLQKVKSSYYGPNTQVRFSHIAQIFVQKIWDYFNWAIFSSKITAHINYNYYYNYNYKMANKYQ